jgi:hypothetical protein
MRALEFVTEKWSAKYKRSINCNNPRGFSQRAHCQGRKKHNEDAVDDLEKDLVEPHSYDAIDHMMQTLARKYKLTPQELHDKFLSKHGISPDDWIKDQLNELSFRGSQCTKDCSGHRAGYEWSQRKGGRDAASWSPSFNKGAWLFKNGY